MARQRPVLIRGMLLSGICGAVAIPLVLILAELLRLTSSGGSAIAATQMEAVLVRVVDGDTLKVRAAGQIETVRLIGIDTPEASPNDKAHRDSARSKVDIGTIIRLGQLAARHLEALIKPGTALKLEFDQERQDRYGRLLAYVYRVGDNLMLNEAMLRDGFAQPYTRPPNLKHASLFRSRAAEARLAKRGLWGDELRPRISGQ